MAHNGETNYGEANGELITLSFAIWVLCHCSFMCPFIYTTSCSAKYYCLVHSTIRRPGYQRKDNKRMEITHVGRHRKTIIMQRANSLPTHTHYIQEREER